MHGGGGAPVRSGREGPAWPDSANRPVYAVGIGPGNPDYVHPRTRGILAAADVTVGFETVLDFVEPLLSGEVLACTYRTEARRLEQFGRQVADGARGVAALMGDPNVSGYTFVDKVDAAVEKGVSVVPGISAVQVAASRARIPIESATIVSLHTRGDLQPEFDRLGKAVGRRPLLILPRPFDVMPERIARTLLDRGASGDLQASVYQSLTLPEETVTGTTLGDLADGFADGDSTFGDLSILVVGTDP